MRSIARFLCCVVYYRKPLNVGDRRAMIHANLHFILDTVLPFIFVRLRSLRIMMMIISLDFIKACEILVSTRTHQRYKHRQWLWPFDFSYSLFYDHGTKFWRTAQLHSSTTDGQTERRTDKITAISTDVFKSTVDYYRRNGSHVFCCFIDFKKAFDRVDYWLLSVSF